MVGAGARTALLALLAAMLVRGEGAALSCYHSSCQSFGGGVPNENSYKVDGHEIIIRHSAGTEINIYCYGYDVLDSPALPRADDSSVQQVTLTNCPLPKTRSLSNMLAALNVTLLTSQGSSSKFVFESLPRVPPLASRHFLGLEGLRKLHVAATLDEHVSPERYFLRPLQKLEELTVENVALPAGELDDPPLTLHSLDLKNAGVERLPEALHSNSSSTLNQLTIASKSALDAVAVPPGLLGLDLQSPATTLQLHTAPALRELMLTNWVEEKPVPLTHCSNLTMLHLKSPWMRQLPAYWLAQCSALETLELQYAANLTSLPSDLLTNASALTSLSFKNCGLMTLPASLLHNVPLLSQFYLTDNRNLSTLPSGTFAIADHVQKLYLFSNDLDDAALAALAPLRNLTMLRLEDNARLRNLCETRGKSPMSKSTQLTELNLSKTNVNHICSDWLHDMPLLKMLDLSYTSVSELWFEDLEFERSIRNAVVILTGAPLTVVGMTRDNYKLDMSQSRRAVIVQVDNNSKLKCDCRMYWTWRSLKERKNLIKHVYGMRCDGRNPLGTMKPEDMLCGDNDTFRECQAASIPTNCSCGWRDHEDSNSSRKLVRVDCSYRHLMQAPRLQTVPDAGQRVYELLLHNNSITELRPDMLRPDITRLDLRNNSLTTVNWESVRTLRSFNGLLQLGGNKFDCSCTAAPLLQTLNNRPTILTDLVNATCEDGSELSTALVVDCPAPVTWIAVGAAVLLALVVITVVFLSSRKRRFFLKAVLHRWGCYWYSAEEDDGRRFDAFVTFSHKDEPTVLELIARLEPPYRLCVHYRDWIPGRYITEQIEESVQDSRRTIALVSRHFLNSGWALAEFRQAHAAAMLEARPRLVVILLEDPSALDLDDQLRRYLATNTYVRWGDPWFWDKLALALPRPRAPDAETIAPATGRVPTASPATNSAAKRAARSPPAPGKPSTMTPAASIKSSTTPIKSSTVLTKTPNGVSTSPNTLTKCSVTPTTSSAVPNTSPALVTTTNISKRPTVKQPPPHTQVTISITTDLKLSSATSARLALANDLAVAQPASSARVQEVKLKEWDTTRL